MTALKRKVDIYSAYTTQTILMIGARKAGTSASKETVLEKGIFIIKSNGFRQYLSNPTSIFHTI